MGKPSGIKRLIAVSLFLYVVWLIGFLLNLGGVIARDVPGAADLGGYTRSEVVNEDTLTPTASKSLKTHSEAFESIAITETPEPTASSTVAPTATASPTPVEEPVESTPDLTQLLTADELKMLYRQGLSECEVMGEARDDCVKGVTSVVLARMALDKKMDGTWSLSDGTIWGTMSIYSGDFPQFTPWNWDEHFCEFNPEHRLCRGKHDLTPYIAPVRAAVNGDGGPCAGRLYYGAERPPDLTTACAVSSGQYTMYFHMGWGWHDILEPGEWKDWQQEGD